MTLRKLGMAGIMGAAFALPSSVPALAADEDIIGLWTGGSQWGEAFGNVLDDPGEVNPITGRLDIRANNFGVGNSTERNLYSGRYADNTSLAFVTAETDPGVRQRQREDAPLYKPQYWPQIEMYGYLHHSDPTGQYLEPRWQNMPIGQPQLGEPDAIVAGPFPNELYFIYGNANQWKYVPTDCREHDESLVYSVSFNGHGVGCWEGDTLVVTSKGFSDQTWLGWPGWVHSIEMELVERFTLNEDNSQITYERIVYDPMLIEPYAYEPDTMNRNTDPMDFLVEDLPYDGRHLVEIGGGG